jgi:hypothetical protein
MHDDARKTWPYPEKEGYPEYWLRHGWYWLQSPRGEWVVAYWDPCCLWRCHRFRSAKHPSRIVYEGWRYGGLCLTPEQVRDRERAAYRAGWADGAWRPEQIEQA